MVPLTIRPRSREGRAPRAWSNTGAGSCKRTALLSWELFSSAFGIRILVLLALGALVGAPSQAGGQASAYVPLDDVAYTYVDALVARGWFKELSMLERPFTERALRVAIDSARVREPGPVISSYLDVLYKAVE